ncbi:MAG TPA: hypothetical protein VII95_16645 [Terriglobales bacterium]|jgi:hypothetical protein
MPETTSMVERPSAAVLEEHRGKFTVTSDLSRMDMNVVHGYLARAYWCEGLPRETLERAMRNSLCFGLFEGENQIGFARVVSDRTPLPTYAMFLCCTPIKAKAWEPG